MFNFRIYVADDTLNSTQAIANLAPPSLTTSLRQTTLMWLSGELPQTGNALNWENWRLEEVGLDGKPSTRSSPHRFHLPKHLVQTHLPGQPDPAAFRTARNV